MKPYSLQPNPSGRSPEELGRLIARAHHQAWRTDAPPLDLSIDELAAILPHLLKSGSAGLIWPRVEPVRERYGALAFPLEAATRAQIIHNWKVQEAIVECVTRLALHGIEPVLVKGLAMAKLYPGSLVRPAGDIDLVVHKEEFAAAHAILHDSTRKPIPIAIDLKHPGIWKECPTGLASLPCQQIELGSVQIKVLHERLNLEMAYRHFFIHGGLRPLWAIDILLLESKLRNAPLVKHEAQPVAMAWQQRLRIAIEQTLNNRPSLTQPTSKLDWIEIALLRNWATPARHDAGPKQILANEGLLAMLNEKWPDPIFAHVITHQAPTPCNPFWIQLSAFLRRSSRHVIRTSKGPLLHYRKFS